MNTITKTKSTMARGLSRMIAMISAVLAYFFLPFATVLAHEGEETVTVLSEADWVGPLAALIIIITAVVIARAIKRNK